MTNSRYDVVGVGNAIVDVIAHADDGFLADEGLAKGVMTLIDADRAERIYADMAPAVEMSGGSAANTLAGLASLGGRGAFIGKVKNDQLGAIFAHDIRAAGIAFATPRAEDGPATARCLIFVTPDAQRTMQTYLGACVELGPEDVDPGVVAASEVTYLEGYLWDPPRARAAVLEAARLAHDAGRKVALTLSDPFCVIRHRAEFRDLVANHVDILFANEAEIRALYDDVPFDECVARVRGHCAVAALTRSERGSVVVSGDEAHEVAVVPTAVVDTTGAGDLYAAGFLHGLTRGLDLVACGRLGSVAAAEVIGHYGARPEASLARLTASIVGHAPGAASWSAGAG